MKNDHDTLFSDALKIIDSASAPAFISDFEDSLKKAVQDSLGEKTALVESSVGLSESETKHLESLLIKIFTHKIPVSYTVNPSLLGGFTIKVNDWVLDASLVSQIDEMRSRLLKEGIRYG